jgi:acetyl-CoA C-acetyltransferase
MILAPLDKIKKIGKPVVAIAGFGQATDTQTLQEREDPTDLKAVRLAAQQAFDMAGIKPEDIDVAELHDAFTILEIAESEHVGFFKKGEGGKAALEGKTRLGGKIPINVSGGLKARGHPVGATGMYQIVEAIAQLRGAAGKNQVKDATIGMTQNIGGSGSNVVTHIFEREA